MPAAYPEAEASVGEGSQTSQYPSTFSFYKFFQINLNSNPLINRDPSEMTADLNEGLLKEFYRGNL